mgnify:CR=1 FL=1
MKVLRLQDLIADGQIAGKQPVLRVRQGALVGLFPLRANAIANRFMSYLASAVYL